MSAPSGCPSQARLEQLLDEQLSAAEEAAIVAHVEGCRPCQLALERLTAGLSSRLGRHAPAANGHTAVVPTKAPQRTVTLDAGPANPQLTVDSDPAEAEEPSASAAEPPAWPAVPGYEILGELGHGGMGIVYKARQTRLNRLVALKMLRAGGHADAADLARFRIEAEAAARLRHPHIVQIYEIGKAGGLPFLALELVEGSSLHEQLQGTPQPARPAAELLATLARAIHAAHEAGIVHRDLKPGNILLSFRRKPPAVGARSVSDGFCSPVADAPGSDSRPPLAPGTPLNECVAKITDFGLAKRLEAETGHTHTGQIMGSPSYMAPEQARGQAKAVGPAADVYALGAILYECLTGRPPFKAASMVETLEQVRRDDPVPPSRLQPKVPRDLETICLKCLRKEPEKRYASAGALAEDLKRFLDGEPIRARRVRLWERAAKWARRRPAAAALLGILVTAAVVLPVAGWQVSGQLARGREAEQKRLDRARAEVLGLHARGQTAAQSEGWNSALELLDQAWQKVEAEPALADLRALVETARSPVRARVAARDTYQRFVRDRDEALFNALLVTRQSSREDVTNLTTAREKVGSALAIVGLSSEGQGYLSLGPSFTREEKEEITNGSCILLLMLAETEARRLPKQTAEEHRLRLEKALKLLDRADELGVRTRAIHLRRARYLTLRGDADGAAKARKLTEALAAETGLNPQDHFLVGHEYYTQGELERAYQQFRRVLQLDARHFLTHYFLAVCCVALGKHEVAVAHLTICQSEQPEVVWIYLLRGFALGQLGDYAAAEGDFDRALALQPSPAARYALYNNRGVLRVGQKESLARGVEDLNQAVTLRPTQYQAYASLAEAYGMDGRLEDAGRKLDEAIARARQQVEDGDLRPTTLAQLYRRRARLHVQRDRQAAVRDLAEAARLAGEDRLLRARADFDRGLVLHLQERFAEALAAYDAALEAEPERIEIIRRRGEVLLALQRYREAAAAFDAYLEKDGPPSAAIYRQRGLARAEVGRHAEAMEDYSRALEMKPKDEERASLHLRRGQEYLASNAMELALRDFEEAVRLDPSRADAYLGRAYARVKLGNAQQGTADADKVVKGEPREPRLWYGAARVYAQAAAQLKPAPGQEKKQTRIRSFYQERALELLRTALNLVPVDERQAYWRQNIVKDAALAPIRGLPGFVRLTDRFGGRDR
jgi:serine/threonine protein kinase/Tfp pilus assembly protein PilF